MGLKYSKFGYSTNLILVNIGVHLTMLTITLSIFLAVNLLALKPWFKSKLKPIIDIFKYGAFLRFWVQTYFEFSVASTLCLQYYSFENNSEMATFFICVFIIVKKYLDNWNYWNFLID